jgi:hypothetical protein
MHPSALLRMPDQAARHQAFASLVRDLKHAVALANAAEQSPKVAVIPRAEPPE